MNQRIVSNPSRSKPTIYDVADRAGVAISTVSRVLNDSMEVSDATRQKVRDAVEALQFRPNRTAKSLAQQSSRTLAVAVPTFTTPFHNELLKGVRSRLKKVDIDLLLCDLKWAAPESTLINFLDRGAMDGLLVAGLPVDERIGAELRKLGAPVVLIGSQWDPLDSFYWDETAGVRLAVEHLIDQGHERIGMITTHVEGAVSRARVRGYQETLAGAGLAVRDAWVATGSTEKHAGFSEEAGHEAMQDLLRTDPGVTAVLASSDVQAIGAWQAIRQAGLEVPDDVALVGYDDVKVSRFIGLSSVAQNMHDIGEEATDLLLRRLNGNEQPDSFSRQVVPELIVRTSS
ncbi:MAG: substrate-binding domain-containing protein [Bacteroidetes bacterium]|jgi:LacI family transcriptional regulator|nr:substrate-binding domain-containing protein [Bacteroidota bacterium]